MSSSRSNNAKPSVGIIVIGDEILKGQTADTNSHFLTRRLFTLGVKVHRISVIPDDVDVIAKEVLEFSNKYTYVITSGGIGPTHDDVTFEGVAKAFDEGVVPNPDLVALCKKFFGTDDLRSPKLKLAFIPESGTLRYGVDKSTRERSRYPLVVVRNVFIFPGVPKLMETAFVKLEDLFRNPDAEFYARDAFVRTDEATIAGVLNEANDRFKDTVTIGSYPDFYNSYYKVKLTLESADKDRLDELLRFLEKRLPEDALVDYDSSPTNGATEKVYGFVETAKDRALAERVRSSLRIIEESLDSYRADEICVGFNGGKDCTALLHLTYAALRRRFGNDAPRLKALYVRRGQPFPELELFIRECRTRYGLELITLNGRIKEVLGELKSKAPVVKAVLMGTRRTDPHSSDLAEFSPTDDGWPKYMRVNPILDWTYTDLWSFVRTLNLPYCTLYDRGYTSLGSMENTHPNPRLQRIDAKGIITFGPAYELMEADSERAGRN